MGFLSSMKMYMKVDGVTGDVVTPSTYLGWIEIYGLVWPGEPLGTPGNSTGSTSDAKRAIRGYPDFPSQSMKDGDVSVSALSGKHSPQIFRMIQDKTRTNVDIWVPLPHNKLLKARLTNVVVSSYSTSTNGEGVSPEQISFIAESGRLRAVP
jgi:type VI protein secretion system component Hcp